MADQQQYDTYGPAVTRRGRTPIQFGDEDPGVSAITYANPDIPTMAQGAMDAIRYHDAGLIPFGQSVHIDPHNRDNTDMGNTIRHEDIHSIVNPLGDAAAGNDIPGYGQINAALEQRGRAAGPYEVPAYVGSNDTQNLQIDPKLKQQYWQNYVNKISAKDPAAGAKLKRFRSTNMPDQDDDQNSTTTPDPNGADAATTSNNTARYKALLAGLGGGMAGAMNATGPNGRPRGPQINPAQFGQSLAGFMPGGGPQNAPMPAPTTQAPGMPQAPQAPPTVGAAPAAQAAQPIQNLPGTTDPNQFAPPPMANGGIVGGWYGNAGTGINPPMRPPVPMAQGGTTVGAMWPPRPAPQAVFDSSWTRTPPNPALPTMADGGAAYGSFANTPMGQAGGAAQPNSTGGFNAMQQPAQQSQQQNSPGLARYGSQGSQGPQQPSQQSFGDGGGGSGAPRGWSGGQGQGPGGNWGGGGQWGGGQQQPAGGGGGYNPYAGLMGGQGMPQVSNAMARPANGGMGMQPHLGSYQGGMGQQAQQTQQMNQMRMAQANQPQGGPQAQSQLMMGNGGQPIGGMGALQNTAQGGQMGGLPQQAQQQQQAYQTQQMNNQRMAQQQPVQSYGFGGNMPPGGQMGQINQMQAGGPGGLPQGPSLAAQGGYSSQPSLAQSGGAPTAIRNGFNPRAGGQPQAMARGGVIDGGTAGIEPPKAESAMRRYSPIGPRNPTPMMTPNPQDMAHHLPRRMSLTPKLNVKLPKPKIPSPTAK